jgi:hypothetical protein
MSLLLFFAGAEIEVPDEKSYKIDRFERIKKDDEEILLILKHMIRSGVLE